MAHLRPIFQYSHYMKTSQLICTTIQLTGFVMKKVIKSDSVKPEWRYKVLQTTPGYLLPGRFK